MQVRLRLGVEKLHLVQQERHCRWLMHDLRVSRGGVYGERYMENGIWRRGYEEGGRRRKRKEQGDNRSGVREKKRNQNYACNVGRR